MGASGSKGKKKGQELKNEDPKKRTSSNRKSKTNTNMMKESSKGRDAADVERDLNDPEKLKKIQAKIAQRKEQQQKARKDLAAKRNADAGKGEPLLERLAALKSFKGGP